MGGSLCVALPSPPVLTLVLHLVVVQYGIAVEFCLIQVDVVIFVERKFDVESFLRIAKRMLAALGSAVVGVDFDVQVVLFCNMMQVLARNFAAKELRLRGVQDIF